MSWTVGSIVFILVVICVYVYTRRKAILLRTQEWGLYIWFVRDILPKIRFSWGHCKINGKQYHEGYAVMQPSDIILSVDWKRLSTWLTPGDDVAHAALCMGRYDLGDEYEIGEMTHKGYTKSDFFDICKTSDRVLIARCNSWDDEYKKDVIARCKECEDTPYDFAFQFGIKALYCSELVYAADAEHRMVVDFRDAIGIGTSYVTPQDILDSLNVTVEWDSWHILDQEKKEELK